MKYFLALTLFVWTLSTAAFAQIGSNPASIKGIVTDSLKAEPLAYVTVSLREVGKTEALKSTYTKENGEFVFSGLALKPYEVIVSYVGFKQKIVKVENLSEADLIADLKKVNLQSSAKQLKEVEITTQKILVQQDIDKISYDVEADPESKSETALNMLRKVPMVTVDADDNIQLKGSSSYKILVNGKSSGLFANNPKDVLKSMPASSIKKIEVVTNPPAKYEAEGVGGIINIITNKKTPGGYNGSVNGAFRMPTKPMAYTAGAYLTVKTGKLGFSGNYGSNTWGPPVNLNNYFRKDIQSGILLSQVGESLQNGGNQYGSGQASFEIDSMNLLTSNFSMYDGHDDNASDLLVASGSDKGLLQKYRYRKNSSELWSGYDIGLDYQHTFLKNTEQMLTLSYKYNLNKSGNLADFNYIPEFNYTDLTGKTRNRNNEGEHTFQADYVHPFGKHTLETGAKSISRNNSSAYYYYSTLNPISNDFEINPQQSNEFNYRQDIYAGYMSVSLKRDKWGLKLGSRMEETVVDAKFISSDTLTKQAYLNIIPSVALSRKLTETQDMKFSYTQRIERPGMWYLNPYTDSTDKKNISYGNPNLDAATNHSFELSHSAFVKSSSFNSSLFYNFTNNGIQQYTTFYPDKAVTTYDNIGKQQNLGLSLNTNLNLTKKFNLSINGNVNYVFLNGFVNGREVKNDGVTAGIYGYGSYKFEKKWRLGGNAGYYSPSVLLQGRSGAYFYNSFSLSKSFLKDDKLTLSFNTNSPFQKFRRWKNELNDPDFVQVQKFTSQNRRFGISFTYKFGQLEGGIAQKKRGIENDDVKSGKSGGAS